MWIGEARGNAIDWSTQRWVQFTGRRVVRAEVPWLDGPCGETRGIGADFFERWGERRGLTVMPSAVDAGLIDGLAALAGPRFDPAAVHPLIDAFYAQTASFDLRIESRWSGPFRLLGWMIARIFARRLAQLNMPLSDRELRSGVDSRIVRLADSSGEVRHTAWIRSSVETGLPVFVGQYGTVEVPGHGGPCVKVVLPLPNGNAIIVLRPQVEPGGGLSLVSDGRRFGDPGFYFTVVAGERELWARYVRTMKERLTLEVAGEGIDAGHRFAVFGLPFLELTYRIVRQSGPETLRVRSV